MCLLFSSSELVRSIGSRHLVCLSITVLSALRRCARNACCLRNWKKFSRQEHLLTFAPCSVTNEIASINSWVSKRRCRVESSGILLIVLRLSVAGHPNLAVAGLALCGATCTSVHAGIAPQQLSLVVTRGLWRDIS